MRTREKSGPGRLCALGLPCYVVYANVMDGYKSTDTMTIQQDTTGRPERVDTARRGYNTWAWIQTSSIGNGEASRIQRRSLSKQNVCHKPNVTHTPPATGYGAKGPRGAMECVQLQLLCVELYLCAVALRGRLATVRYEDRILWCKWCERILK